MQNRKIVFFIQAGVGGAERVSLVFAKHLLNVGYDVKFVFPGTRNGFERLKTILPPDVEYTYIPRSSNLQIAKEFYQIIKKENPSVVFSSVFWINTKLLLLAPLFKNVRFIVRNNIGLYRLSNMQRIVVNLSYRFANAIICQTEEMMEELNNSFPAVKSRTVVLHNPIDTDSIDRLCLEESPYDSSESLIFVSSGRFVPVKGFQVLLPAFKLIRSKYPQAKLYLLGRNDTEFAKSIFAQIEDLGLKDSVICTGFTSNPYKYVRNASCFVLSSFNEGLPNVLLEALYLGTPVASTTCIPVIERIVEDGRTGFLCEKNNIEELAEAMAKASALGRVKTSYKSSSLNEFNNLIVRLTQHC